MRSLIENKKGGFTDLFIFMIFAFVIVIISVVWVYIGGMAEDRLQETIGQMDLHDTDGNNATEVIDNTIGVFNVSISALNWITVFLIGGMVISIFIGSYLVTTKPVFFIPYIFIVIIAIVVAVGISNAYEVIVNDPTLSTTFLGFAGANWILLYLPIWITIIGIGGGIIMFANLGKNEELNYYGY